MSKPFLKKTKKLIRPTHPLFEKLIDKKQLSGKLSCSISFINKLMGQGLPYLKIGRSVRFDFQEVAAWLRNRR